MASVFLSQPVLGICAESLNLVFQEEVLQLAVFTRCTTVAIASSSSSFCTNLLGSGCGKGSLANMVVDGE